MSNVEPFCVVERLKDVNVVEAWIKKKKQKCEKYLRKLLSYLKWEH